MPWMKLIALAALLAGTGAVAAADRPPNIVLLIGDDHGWYKDAGEMALYDMSADLRSERDLAGEHPELVAQFTRKIEDWAASMGIVPGLEVHE